MDLKKWIFTLIVGMLVIGDNFSQTDLVAGSVDYLSKNRLTPKEYILKKFGAFDVILLSEEHRIKENLELVQSLIPDLYKNGIFHIGMEFGAYEDQKTLDSLVTAKAYNEDLARQLMFNYNSGWAYKEYMDIYKSAWAFNKTLPDKSKKFRILNLSYKYHWGEFSGIRSPENMKMVFYQGNTETFRFNIVENEIIKKKEKILILTGDIHAFTKYRLPVYDYIETNFVRFENKYFGNLLYTKYPQLVFSVLLHKPFNNYLNKLPVLVSPANGRIEEIMRKINNTPVGFDLVKTPLGQLPDSSYYSMGYDHFNLSKIYDGYIFLKPVKDLIGCTIDPLFLNEENWTMAINNMADPDWRPRPKSLEEYWKQISDYTDVAQKYKMVDKN